MERNDTFDWTLRGLHPWTNYSVAVRAFTVDAGPESPWVVQTTLEAGKSDVRGVTFVGLRGVKINMGQTSSEFCCIWDIYGQFAIHGCYINQITRYFCQNHKVHWYTTTNTTNAGPLRSVGWICGKRIVCGRRWGGRGGGGGGGRGMAIPKSVPHNFGQDSNFSIAHIHVNPLASETTLEEHRRINC